MATIQLPPDFKEFLRLFHKHNVEYLLVGGYAVGYHGHPRTTGGMDVWVSTTPENAERIVAALKEFGFDVPGLAPDLFLKSHNVVRMGVPPLQIQTASTVSGVEFDECFKDRVKGQLDGIEVTLISLKHLKLNKKAAGRARDLADLENLP